MHYKNQKNLHLTMSENQLIEFSPFLLILIQRVLPFFITCLMSGWLQLQNTNSYKNQNFPRFIGVPVNDLDHQRINAEGLQFVMDCSINCIPFQFVLMSFIFKQKFVWLKFHRQLVSHPHKLSYRIPYNPLEEETFLVTYFSSFHQFLLFHFWSYLPLF